MARRKGWRGPEYEGEFPSLGWQIIETWADVFPSPRDENAGFLLTDEQALIIVEWYRVDPVTCEFVYDRGCSRRSKGIGKSPIEAAKCITELALPCVPDGFDADGEPVARPWGTGGLPTPWIQIASRSEDQDDNTWSPLYYLLTANDSRAADELRLDPGLTRCYHRDIPGAKIEPVSSAGGSREGQPIVYVNLDETGYMLRTNGGWKLAQVTRNNVAKMGGRAYESTNGFRPGDGSVAELTHKAALVTPSIFYDAIEAPTSVVDDDGKEWEVTKEAPDWVLRSALEVAYGDRWWVNIDRLVRHVKDPDKDWSDSERFFFNWNRKSEGVAVTAAVWAELARLGDAPPARTRIGVGFDGSISDDATFLRGCTAAGHRFLLGKWERPRDEFGKPLKGWTVPRTEVLERIAWTFATYDVGLFHGDPPKWYTELEQLQAEHGVDVVVPFDTNQHSKMAKAVDRWRTANALGTATHDGDEATTRHVLAAHLMKVRVKADEEDNRTMYVLVKGDDGAKIDGAVADVLAFEAAMTMPVLVDSTAVHSWDAVLAQMEAT